jgi:transporter family protein
VTDPIVFAAGAALVWGLSSFVEKVGLRGGTPEAGVLARSLGVALGAALYAAVSPSIVKSFVRMPGRSFLCFLGGGVMASVFAQVLFYKALNRTDVGRAAAVGGAWPAVAFLMGVLFLGEPLSVRRVLGVGVVITGVMLLR